MIFGHFPSMIVVERVNAHMNALRLPQGIDSPRNAARLRIESMGEGRQQSLGGTNGEAMDHVTQLLERARTIAIVGMSDQPHRDSYWIGEFLINQGYTVYPVNPRIRSVFGLKAYPDLRSVPENIDIVDVFRNPFFAKQIVRDSIAVGAKAVWFQLGAEDAEAAKMGRDAGLEVITGLCIAVEYRRRRIIRQPHLHTGPGDARLWRPAV